MAEKKEKLISAKKLPGILKKAYTKDEIQKKLISKIYIESDKKLISSFFNVEVAGQKVTKYKANLDVSYPKKEFKHLKSVAKAIKANRCRFRIGPFAAVAGFLAFIICSVLIFKNPVTKFLITSGCEEVFGAKTTIDKVDVQLLGIKINITGLKIGNKNSKDGMKDLFDANIVLDVNFAQALRGKFVSDHISVTDIKFGRERTEKEGSCILPLKSRKLNIISEKSSIFMDSVKERSKNSAADLKMQMETLLGGASPDEIVKNLESKIQSKDAALELKAAALDVSSKWKTKPEEIKTSAKDVASKIQEYKKLNIKSMTPVEAAEKIKEINATLKELDSITKTVNSIKTDFDSDMKKMNAASKNMKDAIASDKALAENMVNTVKNAGSILTSALDTVGYDMLGNYYPYAKQAMDYALQMKNNSSASSEKSKTKEKKSVSEVKGSAGRMKGTTFWYGTENPGLWIKLVEATGENFKGNIKDISSDPDMIGKTVVGTADFKAKDILHTADFVVDARSASKASLIQLGYKGKGFAANIDGSKIAKASGIPSISGLADVTLKGTLDPSGISAGGTVDLSNARLTSDGFGNEKLDKYYKMALESVKALSLGYNAGFTEAEGVNLKLTGNYTEVFAKALSSVAASAGNEAKAKVTAKIAELTDSYSKEALSKVSEVTGISTELNTQINSVSDMKKVLEEKLKELAKQQTNAAATKAAEKVTEKLNNTAAGAAAADAASKLLKLKK